MSLYRTLYDLYDKGGNISSYLKENSDLLRSYGLTQSDAIAISYDLQAGSYVQEFFSEYEKYSRLTSYMIDLLYSSGVFNDLESTNDTLRLCDLGTGEATRYVPLLNNLPSHISRRVQAFGIDLSISRLHVAKHFSAIKGGNIQPQFLSGDLIQTPFAENSCDLVFAMHSIEPNGGSEQKIIDELVRVSSNYIILLEPIFETACKDQQTRMKSFGYITKLKTLLCENQSLTLLLEEQIPEELCVNPLNTPSLLILKKLNGAPSRISSNPFQCPVTASPLQHESGYWISEDGLAYPEIEGIPLLRPCSALPFYSKSKTLLKTLK